MVFDNQSELVKEEFSRAKEYASEYFGNNPQAHFFKIRLQRVRELLGDFVEGKVLDIGCGPGVIGETFCDKPINYYGIDISEEMIKECTNAFGHDPRFQFAVGRAEDLPFPDSSFDVVLCLGIFEYIQNIRLALIEVARVLKPKGIIIVTMLNKNSLHRLWQRFGYAKLNNKVRELGHLLTGEKNIPGSKRLELSLYSETTFRNLVTSIGFEIEDLMYYDFDVLLPLMDSLFPKISVSLSNKLEILCRSKIKFLGVGFMLKCRKS